MRRKTTEEIAVRSGKSIFPSPTVKTTAAMKNVTPKTIHAGMRSGRSVYFVRSDKNSHMAKTSTCAVTTR